MKRLLKIPEFLDTYSISRTAFYREVGAGRLTVTKIGSSSRILVEDAEAWAANLPKGEKAA